MCICQECGCSYQVDFILPDDLWIKISPKKSEAGLLCGPCITEELETMNGPGAYSIKKT